MKLKQALIIGLSSAILAIPAIAAESTGVSGITTFSDVKGSQPAAEVTPTKKEAVRHRKCHKKVSLEGKTDEQAKEEAKLDELNTLNSAEENDQTEKNSIKS